MKIIIYIALFCSFALTAAAQKGKSLKNPIETALEKCLQTHHGTMPRVRCYNQASEAWEKKVEDEYALLLTELPAAPKAILEKDQSAWEAYEAREESLIVSLYPQRGSGHTAVRIIEIMKSYQDRAAILEMHLRTAESLTNIQ